MFEKIFFLLALAGSVLYIFDSIASKMKAAYQRKQIIVPLAKPQKIEESSKKEPSLESQEKDSNQKVIIELLTAHAEELAKLTRVVDEANTRLAALEAPKPKAARRSPTKASASTPPDNGDEPSLHEMTRYESLPPTSGGFEPVH